MHECIARLRVVIGVLAMIPAIRGTFDRQRRFGEIRLCDPFAPAVRLKGGASSAVAVDPHLAIAMIAVGWASGGIDRDRGVVDAEPIALRVAVGGVLAASCPAKSRCPARCWQG